MPRRITTRLISLVTTLGCIATALFVTQSAPKCVATGRQDALAYLIPPTESHEEQTALAHLIPTILPTESPGELAARAREIEARLQTYPLEITLVARPHGMKE